MSDKRVSTVRLIWLEALVAVAKHRSYKDAGLELKLDPTIISGYVKNLEKWLGVKLIINNNKSILITDEGNDFLHKANTIIYMLYGSRNTSVVYPEIKKIGNEISALIDELYKAKALRN